MAAAAPDITSLHLTVQKERAPHFLPISNNGLGFTGISHPPHPGPEHLPWLDPWGPPWESAAAGWGKGNGPGAACRLYGWFSELTQSCFPGVEATSEHTLVCLTQSIMLNLPSPCPTLQTGVPLSSPKPPAARQPVCV